MTVRWLLLTLIACGDNEVADTGGTDGGVEDGGVEDGGSTDGGVEDGGVEDGGSTDGGGTSDGGVEDGGVEDGGVEDGGSTDGGSADGGSSDGGVEDGGVEDGGVEDGGVEDGGVEDGGSSDGGSPDGGSPDGGSSDGGSPDGGSSDGGAEPEPEDCADRVDNDLDGYADSRDTECLDPGQLRLSALFGGDDHLFVESLGTVDGVAWLALDPSGGSVPYEGRDLFRSEPDYAVLPLDGVGVPTAAYGLDGSSGALYPARSDGAGAVLIPARVDHSLSWEGTDLDYGYGFIAVDSDGSATWVPLDLGFSHDSGSLAIGAFVDDRACFVYEVGEAVEVGGETWFEDARGWIVGQLRPGGDATVLTTVEIEDISGGFYLHALTLDDGGCLVSGVVRGAATLGDDSVDGGDLGHTVVARLDAHGSWTWLVESDSAAGHGLLQRTAAGFVLSGEGSTDFTGPGWTEVTGSGFLLELDEHGGLRRTVTIGSSIYAEPEAFLELDDGTWVFSGDLHGSGSDSALLVVDGELVEELPDLEDETQGIVALAADDTLAWFGRIQQDSGGSGLTGRALFELDEELGLLLQVYGDCTLRLDPDGPNAEVRTTDASSVLLTTWMP